LYGGATCGEVGGMSCIHAKLVAMTAASASATACLCALNNNNANNNTRMNGWAGV